MTPPENNSDAHLENAPEKSIEKKTNQDNKEPLPEGGENSELEKSS
jgi:hypothetical protein